MYGVSEGTVLHDGATCAFRGRRRLRMVVLGVSKGGNEKGIKNRNGGVRREIEHE